MKCPKCQRRLKVEATSCICGWGTSFAQPEQKALPKCEVVPGCIYPARLMVNGKKTCVVHYDEALRPTVPIQRVA